MTSSLWPTGKKAAFCISVDVDADSPLLWRMRNEDQIRYISELEQRQHGIRYGIDAICELFRNYNLRATFFVPAIIAERNRELLNNILLKGHEIGLHGYAHEAVRDITDTEFTKALERSITIFERQTESRKFTQQLMSDDAGNGVHQQPHQWPATDQLMPAPEQLFPAAPKCCC